MYNPKLVFFNPLTCENISAGDPGDVDNVLVLNVDWVKVSLEGEVVDKPGVKILIENKIKEIYRCVEFLLKSL